MHATVPVEADLLHVPPGLAEQGPALVPEAHGRPVEVGILGVVGHAVVHDEVEVALELLQVAVLLRVDALPHGGEVHRVLDVVKVVGHLWRQRNRRVCAKFGLIYNFYIGKSLTQPINTYSKV